ncbi:MAG: hypothetical protein K2U26_05995 [Cyclobacteriaceae bacterium]|nr:hypothetical protein [Cyclobacteriaceae bacterium]
MLNRIKELLRAKNDFGFETTLATRSYVHLINEAKNLGYTIVLVFFWLESVELARARVRSRVEKGGHDIPSTVIERRYYRGISNFFNFYQKMSDRWAIYDNSSDRSTIVAIGSSELVIEINNHDIWKRLLSIK